MQITYSKFEHELNGFLKSYLEDDSFDHLKERLDLSENKADLISEKINDFYNQQLQIDKNYSKDRIRVDRIITFSEKTLPKGKFCKFLIELARICLSEGNLELASEIFRKANRISDNDSIKAESLFGLADVFSRKANWTRSLEAINKANSIFKNLDDLRGVAKCQNFLGAIYGEMGDIHKAKRYLQISLSLINRDEDLELAANSYTNIGIIYNIQECPNDAISHLNRALTIYKKLGNHKNASEVNLNIGLVHFDSGNYESALFALDEAIELAKSNGFLSTLSLAYLAKSQVLIKLDNFYYAAEFTDKALEISHNSDDKLTLAEIYKVKGIIERHLKNFVASETYLLNSLRINNNLNNELNAAETSFELGVLYDNINDSNSKKSYLGRSQEYFENIGATTKVERIEQILGFSAS